MRRHRYGQHQISEGYLGEFSAPPGPCVRCRCSWPLRCFSQLSKLQLSVDPDQSEVRGKWFIFILVGGTYVLWASSAQSEVRGWWFVFTFTREKPRIPWILLAFLSWRLIPDAVPLSCDRSRKKRGEAEYREFSYGVESTHDVKIMST